SSASHEVSCWWGMGRRTSGGLARSSVRGRGGAGVGSDMPSLPGPGPFGPAVTPLGSGSCNVCREARLARQVLSGGDDREAVRHQTGEPFIGCGPPYSRATGVPALNGFGAPPPGEGAERGRNGGPPAAGSSRPGEKGERAFRDGRAPRGA